MADGFTLSIDDDLAELLERRAKEAGAPVDVFAREALTQALFRYADYEWIGDDPRTTPHPSEYKRGAVPLEEVESRIRAKLDRMLGPA